MVAAEVSISTGEAVREWRPARVPSIDGCGVLHFGFPIP